MPVARISPTSASRSSAVIEMGSGYPGAHLTLVPRVVDGLRERGLGHVLVVVGGTIPPDDIHELERRGVAAVFTPGAPTSEIVAFLENALAAPAV